MANDQEGYIVSIAAFFMLIIMLSLAISMSFLVANRQKNITNVVKSTQSYYAAEAGIEDALIRLKKSPQMSQLTYNLGVNGATATVVIPSIIGGSRPIVSQGVNGSIHRNIQATYSIDTENISFYYGAQAGAGGLIMSNESRIIGNVFSGGDISGSGTIDNNVVISGNGHSIKDVYVGGDVFAYSCLSGASVRNLTYVTGGTHTCTVRPGGTTSEQSQEISQQPLPIPQSQIDDWKSEAATACNSSDVSKLAQNNKSVSMGLCKITGNLNFGNGTTLTLTGTVYVTGNVTFGQHDTLQMSNSYVTPGGVFISDGLVDIGTNNTFSGSGQAGSYLLIISTSSSDSAITVSNNSSGAVFYTSAGGLRIRNNVSVIEAVGYKIIMDNGSQIQYSTGIVNIYFSSGPGGGWKLTNWQEQ